MKCHGHIDNLRRWTIEHKHYYLHLIEIATEEMKRWPCRIESDEVLSRKIGPSQFWLAYNPGAEMLGRWSSSGKWHANIEGDVFYLLTIGICDTLRGKGYGAMLYEIIEDIALKAGCREIWQTASGWTQTGESRCSYLTRRGWLPSGIEVMKFLKPKSEDGS